MTILFRLAAVFALPGFIWLTSLLAWLRRRTGLSRRLSGLAGHLWLALVAELRSRLQAFADWLVGDFRLAGDLFGILADLPLRLSEAVFRGLQSLSRRLLGRRDLRLGGLTLA